MEHIRLFDWCRYENTRKPENFVEEEDLDNSVTERLIRGKFRDPLLPEYKDEGKPINIDWDEIFKKKPIIPLKYNTVVPGLQPVVKHPKLSALSSADQFVILKILVVRNPLVLKKFSIPRPSRKDYKRFIELQPIYEKEQAEYVNWAKTMWKAAHNIKALKTHKILESVYDAIYNLHLNMTLTIPRHYEMVAMVELNSRDSNQYNITFVKDLIKVTISQLPEVVCPCLLKRFTVYKDKPTLPKSCMRHPCRVILPVSTVPTEADLTDIHQDLGQYAMDHNIKCIISEESLCCLLESNRYWLLPVSVRPTFDANGEKCNAFVIGTEIFNQRQPARCRAYSAMHYLLHTHLLKDTRHPTARKGPNFKSKDNAVQNDSVTNNKESVVQAADEDSDSEDEDGLVIDFDKIDQCPIADDQERDDEESQIEKIEEPPVIEETSPEVSKESVLPETPPSKRCKTEMTDTSDTFKMPPLPRDMRSCTCSESPPIPKRSYKIWKFKNTATGDSFEVIIHSPHRCRYNDREALLEPILEYQLELGASVQSDVKLKSLALSLFLRPGATLLNVRVDPTNGDIVHYEHLDFESLNAKLGKDLIPDIANTLYTSLAQLQRLLPGEYLLQHESNHGANAKLHVFRPVRGREPTSVNFNGANVKVPDDVEIADLQTPPTLTPILLPYHKYRRLLPLAFTSNDNMVSNVCDVGSKKQPPSQRRRKKKRKTAQSSNKAIPSI